MNIDKTWTPIICAGVVLLYAALTEWLHYRRIRKVGRLAFGPSGRPRLWIKIAFLFRVILLSSITWSIVTLVLLKTTLAETQEELPKKTIDSQNVVFVFDISPSMLLVDAGPKADITRKEQMKNVVCSMLDRMGKQVRYSVICFYTRALPLMKLVSDKEVVRNVFNDLPIEYAMRDGKTDMGAAINKAIELINSNAMKNVTLIICADGDTVDIEDQQPVPPQLKRSLVLGFGDSQGGLSIDSHISRQEAITLQHVANSLKGEYIDANVKHIPTSVFSDLCQSSEIKFQEGLSKGDLALYVFLACSFIYALLPILMELWGADWKTATKKAEVDA